MRWFERLSTVFFILLTSLFAVTATADMQHSKKSDIQAHMAWVRAGPPVATNTAAYMMLHNYSQQDDRVVAIESSMAEVVEIHSSEMNDGVMKMSKLQEVVVPAKGYIMFEPAGHHIMLINLKQPLNVGSMVPITLIFEQHGRIEMQLVVSHPPENSSPGNTAPRNMDMQHSGHKMDH